MLCLGTSATDAATMAVGSGLLSATDGVLRARSPGGKRRHSRHVGIGSHRCIAPALTAPGLGVWDRLARHERKQSDGGACSLGNLEEGRVLSDPCCCPSSWLLPARKRACNAWMVGSSAASEPSALDCWVSMQRAYLHRVAATIKETL